jgi:hypothetical protein
MIVKLALRVAVHGKLQLPDLMPDQKKADKRDSNLQSLSYFDTGEFEHASP